MARSGADSGPGTAGPVRGPTRRRAPTPSIRADNVALEASAGTGKTRVLVTATSTCCAPASTREHPRDHLHAQGRRRDARAHHERAAGAPPARRARRRRAGASCAIASATSRSAPSTRSACRCCASSRSRPISIPASILADETEVAAARSTSRSTARCAIGRALARDDDGRRAGVRGARRAAAAQRPGGAARSPARRARALARYLGCGRATDAGRALPRGGAQRLRDVFAAHAGRPGRRSSASGPGRPSALFALLRSSAICVDSLDRDGWPPTPATSVRRCASLATAARYFLTQEGKPRKRSLTRKATSPPTRTAGSAPRPRCRHVAPACSSARRGVRARPQRAARARRPAGVRDRAGRVPAHARRARRARFLRPAGAHAGAARPDGGVLAQPLPARVALPPRAGRRVPGHQPRAVAAGRRCWSRRGARASASARATDAAVDLHRRRSQAVDLRLPRRRRRACSTRPARFIEELRPDGGVAARDHAQLPRRCGSCWRSSTTSAPRSSKAGGAAPMPSATTTTIGFRSTTAVTPPASRGARRCVAGRRRGARAPQAVAAEIARLLADGDGPRSRHRRRRAPAAPGDIAILFRTRESHREFERALEARGIPIYVYKGLGFFDADEIKDVVALLRYLADPESDLRAAAFLRSRFVALSDEALRRLAPASRRVVARAGRAAATRARWRRRPARAASGCATRVAAAGWRWSIGCRRPSSSIACSPNRPTPCELRGPAPSAGAREPEEAARPGPPHPESRLRDAGAHRRSPRSAGGRRRVQRRASTRPTPST